MVVNLILNDQFYLIGRIDNVIKKLKMLEKEYETVEEMLKDRALNKPIYNKKVNFK